MNEKRSRKWIFIVIGILLFIAVAVLLSQKLIDWITENKRVSTAPPTVQITSPIAGEIFPVGQTIYAGATATGTADIQYIELQLDGESIGKAFNDLGGEGAFVGSFEFTISEGGHMLSVRTVDKAGLVGQGIPIPIYGNVKTENDGALAFVSQEGDTLASLAGDFGVDLDDVNQLNPGLGDGALPPGTRVDLPVDNKEEPAPEPSAAGGGQPDQPAAAPKKEVAPPNTPMLATISTANPIINPFKAITQIKPPQAPDGLEVSQEGCLVTMKWNDNSDSEDSYRIWFTGLGLPPRVIATVSSSKHTGPVWYQFNTPPAGIYGFWVEAVNILGAQPSEEFWLGIPATQCEDFTAAYLDFSVWRLTVRGNYERVYCYVSAEGAPEQRYPSGENSFFDAAAPPGQLPGNDFFYEINIDGGGFTIPYPEDGSVDIAGECMAWSGGTLNSLGEFSATLTATEKEFANSQLVENSNFQIYLTIKPSGLEDPQGTYTFFNPLIKAPFDLQLIDTDHRDYPDYPTNKYLTWDWKGDESEITGFTVFLNGNPFKQVFSHQRSINYSPPAKCGMHMKFEVGANLPHGQSPRSEAKEYDLDPCPLRAEVQFVSIVTGFTNDSFSGECDTLEAYFYIFANNYGYYNNVIPGRFLGESSNNPGILRKGQSSRRYPMTCNHFYTFDDIGYATTNERNMDRIIVQIEPDKPYIYFGMHGWDYDWGTPNDEINNVDKVLKPLPLDNWQGYEEEFTLTNLQYSAYTTTVIRVRALPDSAPW